MKPTVKFENQFIGPVILTAAEISCCENSSATIYHGTPPMETKSKIPVLQRGSRPEVFCKKGVLRNFAKFTGKHLCQSLFFNKVAGLSLQLH